MLKNRCQRSTQPCDEMILPDRRHAITPRFDRAAASRCLPVLCEVVVDSHAPCDFDIRCSTRCAEHMFQILLARSLNDQTKPAGAAYNHGMSGFRSNFATFLAALLMACPSLGCVQFSLDHTEQTAHDSCCHATHESPPDRPSEPTIPDDNCCCQADLTLPSNSMRVADGDVLSLVDFFVEPEQTLATALPTSCHNGNTGPPLRVLQCVWLI